MHCAHCGEELSPGARFCSSCGSVAASLPSEMPTTFAPTPTSHGARGGSHTPSVAFAPGQVLADRYRIVGLLGRGGMGEVYRADDLKLGQAVALKFLPRDAEKASGLLERFHAEVRTARQVSHPHVCRVYDIGDFHGRHFLSMEYVDGEDLSSLLRRIGRLPPAKAVEIAQQIAAGLAAAHEKGVLHRDLKPANVMIDGNGRARITDFGLAVLTDEAAAELAGTPAYMAPEQLAGRPATVQSDLYSLGLVLYELFTGQRAFEAQGVAEWRRVHAETQPTSPSLITADMDPAVERVILRCLEKDPAARPRSAGQVALALPGGDPLAAALAAGETPSPEMVAAAGGEGGLEPRRAWALLALFLATLVAVFLLTPASTDLGLAPMEKSPDTLKDRARETARAFGYVDPAADEVSWLTRDYSPIRWLADNVRSTDWRRRLPEIGSPVLFVYRSSKEPLVAQGANSLVTATDPSLDRPGELLVALDAEERLRQFRAAPSLWTTTGAPPSTLDEADLFRRAGLERARFEAVTPEYVPPVPFDLRREWTGTRAAVPEMPLRLSAAVFEGRLVHVAVLGPWDSRDSVDPLKTSAGARISLPVLSALLLLVLVTAVLFALRNLRLGRGDRRGATRLAGAAFLLQMLAWAASAHLVLEWSTLLFEQLLPAIGEAGMTAGVVWLSYVALEPFIRRRMPNLLVGWARALDGRWRDPRVGRDVLLGLALGGLFAVLHHLVNGAPTWIPLEHQTTIRTLGFPGDNRLDGTALPFQIGINAILRTITILTFLFAARLVLTRTWMVALAVWLITTALALGGENAAIEVPAAAITGGIVTLAMVGLGPLATVATFLAFFSLTCEPLRASLSAWYAPHAVFAWIVLCSLGILGFRSSLGGRPAFGKLQVDA